METPRLDVSCGVYLVAQTTKSGGQVGRQTANIHRAPVLGAPRQGKDKGGQRWHFRRGPEPSESPGLDPGSAAFQGNWTPLTPSLLTLEVGRGSLGTS